MKVGNMIYGLQCWVLNHKNEILLLKRAPDKKVFPEYWSPVAAAPLDEHDDMEQRVHRELLDETGHDGVIVFGDKVVSSHIEGQDYVIHSFVAKADFSEPKLNEEHTEWKFVPYSEISKYQVVPQSLSILEEYFRQ